MIDIQTVFLIMITIINISILCMSFAIVPNCKKCNNFIRIQEVKKAKKLLRLKDCIDKDFLIFIDKKWYLIAEENFSSLFSMWKEIKNNKCISCEESWAYLTSELYKDKNGNTINSIL